MNTLPNVPESESSNRETQSTSAVRSRMVPTVNFERTATACTNKGPFSFYPVTEFGGRGIHRASADGRWNVNRFAEDHESQLIQSEWDRTSAQPNAPGSWSAAVIRLGACEYLEVYQTSMMAYAETPGRAREILEEFSTRYAIEVSDRDFEFEILQGGYPISTLRMNSAVPGLGDTELDRNYGVGFSTFHRNLLKSLRQDQRGITLLHGPSGTGKTTYLKQLMAELSSTHRFYVVNRSLFHIITDMEFVTFWANQRYRYQNLRVAIVTEDCDPILLRREVDNLHEVSTLLGMTDGIIGELLNLQIVCTANCKLKDIDQSLLRPGRLIAERYFDRLTKPQAAKIAEALGRRLHNADDYSLAEVYGGPDLGNDLARQQVGFAAGDKLATGKGNSND